MLNASLLAGRVFLFLDNTKRVPLAATRKRGDLEFLSGVAGASTRFPSDGILITMHTGQGTRRAIPSGFVRGNAATECPANSEQIG